MIERIRRHPVNQKDTGEGRKGGMLGKELPFFLGYVIEKMYVRIALADAANRI